MNQKLRNKRFLSIDKIYAFIATEEGGEGIVGMLMPNNEWMPFIGADIERVDQLKKLADAHGLKYEIRCFVRVLPRKQKPCA